MDNDASRSRTATLATPGDVLAQIPSILGFYPKDSFLAVCFHSGGGSRFTLGPVLRFDLAERTTLAEGLDKVQRARPALVLAFVIGAADPESGYPAGWAEFAELLSPHLAECGLEIAGYWQAREIAEGVPYRLLDDGPGAPAAGTARSLRGWDGGAIGSVVGALAHTTMMAHGDLPELNREATISFFDRRAQHAPPVAQVRKRMAAHCAEMYLGNPEARERCVRGAIAEFGRVVREVTEENLDSDALLGRTSTLVLLAAYLATHRTRDVLLGETLRAPEPAMEVALAMARCLDGVMRANALCLYAAGAAATGRTYRAWPALIAAQEEVPGHTLSRLMQETIATTGVACLLDCLRRGSECDSARRA